MNKIEIITSTANGVFKRNRNLVLSAIKSFEGKEYIISFSRLKKQRSNGQNRFYWGVVIPLIQQGLFDATGEFRTAENIHYKILLPLFAPVNEIANKETGEMITERLTSSELTTTQWMEYIMEVQKWSAEFLGVDIPDPNEDNLLNFNQ